MWFIVLYGSLLICIGPTPRVDKFACKNCGKSGHKIADCMYYSLPSQVFDC